MLRRAGYGLAVLAAYAGAVAWLTWPLAASATAFLANPIESCRWDASYSAWAMAWTTHALLGGAPLADANIYHPTPDAFFYGPSAFGALLYYAPVLLATGNPTLATNVTLLGGIALTAWGVHLVVERWTGSRAAGVVAAAAVLTNNWLTYVFVPTTPHMAALQWLPWIMLAASARPARPGVLLLLVVLQGLTDPVYVAPTVLAPLGLLALGRLARPATRADGLRLAAALVAIALVLVPLYLPYLRVRAANPMLSRQSVWSPELTPTELPITLWFRAVPARVPPAMAALIALGLVAFAVQRGRDAHTRAAWLHGGLWAGVGLYLSFGPAILWRGTQVLLPQAHLPGVLALYQTLRVPGRLGIAAMVGFAVLAGAAFAEVTAWARRGETWRTLAGWALAVIIVVALHRASLVPGGSPMGRPYPVFEAPHAPAAILAAVRRAGGPVLVLPAEVDRVEAHADAMYLSIAHAQPLLNGYASFYPADFPSRMDTARRLPELSALRTLVHETGVHLVWIRAKYPLANLAAWRSLADAGGGEGLRLVARDADDLVFAVDLGG